VRQHDLGAVDVGLDRPHGAVDDELDADSGGQVHDDVGLVDELGDHGVAIGRADRVLEARIALQVADVLHAAGREVIEQMYRVVVLDQQIAQMRADEAGSAGDQEPHLAFADRAGPREVTGTSEHRSSEAAEDHDANASGQESK